PRSSPAPSGWLTRKRARSNPIRWWGTRAEMQQLREQVSGGNRATLEKDPHDVARMFDGVARRYDVTNTVLSFAQDRRWRRRTRQCLQLQPGEQVLDLAAGTGVSTVELSRGGARAVACDFSLGMLRAGQALKRRRRRVPFVAGDATA